MLNNQDIYNKIISLEQSIKALNGRMDYLQSEMAKYATQGQLKISEANTKNIINSNSQAITLLEEKLNMIVLPDQTKYFLSANEINDFKSNYQSLIAMMTDAERLYQSLITYVSQLKL